MIFIKLEVPSKIFGIWFFSLLDSYSILMWEPWNFYQHNQKYDFCWFRYTIMLGSNLAGLHLWENANFIFWITSENIIFYLWNFFQLCWIRRWKWIPLTVWTKVDLKDQRNLNHQTNNWSIKIFGIIYRI